MTSPIDNAADMFASIRRVGATSDVSMTARAAVTVSNNYASQSEPTINSVKLSPDEQAVVSKLESGLKALGSVRMGILLDQASKKPIIKIFDKESGQEILQIPAKHSLRIADTVEIVRGLIFDKKV